MLKQRVITAIVGIPLLLWIAYLGGPFFRLLVALVVLAGAWEYFAMLKKKGYHLSPLVLFVSAVLVPAALLDPKYAGGAFFLVVFLHLAWMVFGRAKPHDAALSLFGVFFITWTLAHLILIRENQTQGFVFVLLTFLITWSTDTGAYFAGRFFGRRKLSPAISPNKTVEGAIGGIALCVFAAMTLGHFLRFIDPLPLFILALIASAAGQIGDLAESAVKRWAGVKDSGSLIPGHGGVLDRFDSLILAAPMVYYFLQIWTLR
jgi:phosphatidate cytidylyltransferase